MSASTDFLAGGGEMGARMRSLDWAATPLGPASQWPQSLRSAVSILLPSKAQIVLFWGPDFITLYNDAYRPVFGGKHPWALGRPARECWREVWDVLQPLFEGVMRTGEAFWAKDHPFYLERHHYLEETYFDVSYDPVRDESGRVGGVFCIVSETTGRVVGERRLRTLRELAGERAFMSSEEVCRQAAAVLAQNPADVPFALLFLLDDAGGVARLVDVAGVSLDAMAAVKEIDLTSTTPASEVLRPRTATETTPDAFVSALPPTASPDRALVLPLLAGVQPAGFLVCGVSRHHELSGHYRDFFDLVASHVSSALTGVRAYDEERRRAQALAELDRAKTTFFSNVSHEFRTPLTLMLGPIEDLLLDAQHPLAREHRAQLESAHRNSLRLLKLVNTLLDFSRIEAGRVQAVYEPTDLGPFTAELASNFRSAIEKAGLRLRVHCPTTPAVYVDRDMWEKIVLNLLSNAFKFTLEGEIEVRLSSPEGDRVELVVRDTGTGIPAAEIPHLFERFHRVRGARGRTHEGTGIGLALVQELVRLHGGSIRAESVPDHGSTFTVSIPTGTAHLPPDRIGGARTRPSTALGAGPFVEEAQRWLPDAADLPASRPPYGTELDTAAPSAFRRGAGDAGAERAVRILCADDNADMREYIRRLLSSIYDVETVADGQAALERIQAHPPDLVLTDIMMPRLDGVALLQAIRGDEKIRSLPVIMLSARAGEESRIEGLEVGADAYLTKPFSARELLARISALVELARVRREAERALRDADRRKDEFLATLSHELRTPLTSMLGWVRMLKLGQLNAEQAARALEVIERSTLVQARLIDDLLDVSRIVTGKLHLEFRAVDLSAVVEAGLETVRHGARSKGVELVSALDPGAGPVFGDHARLLQVVVNLLTNAVKFTPAGGRLAVSLARVDPHAVLTVTDTGAGIDARDLPHVFDRFRQAESGTSRRHGGLGLGLSIVRSIVEAHKGSVAARSDGVDRGATFTVTLPLMAVRLEVANGDEALATRPVAIAASGAALHGLRILAVDDEADARDLLSLVLQQAGAQVEAAASVAQAMESLEERWPDIIVSDIAMPSADGYELIARIRKRETQRGSRVAVVALTAYASDHDRDRVLSSGFDAYLTKPAEPRDLVRTLAALMMKAPRTS